MSDIRLNVNDKDLHVDADPEETLLSVLRNRLQLTGAKYGCGEGECGACTVLMNGAVERSCIKKVGEVGNARILTIEGVERDGALSSLQQAFLEEEALQCGYCTPGMILSATALLREHPHPSDQQIIEHMNGNVCRCGVYPRIVAAIRRASQHTAERRQA
ncbi:MAG: (2Fe-2S)-binding protein [Acidobacteriaceae bacterium]